MTGIDSDRRRFLAASGTALTIAVAGCSDDDNGDDDDGNGAPDGVPQEVHDYLTDNEANLYDNEVVDETGQDSITIENGAGENGYAFNPAAVRVDPGTEVTWEWTGEGGAHNVESTEGDGDFTSGDGEEGDDITFTHTFEDAGNYMYQCGPHLALGMHGAVIVE